MATKKSKPIVATCWLAGCAGCHMSFLDIDERIVALSELVDFSVSPITDFKELPEVDIALIEGAVANEDNNTPITNIKFTCTFIFPP
jgi:NAD-reducing hydrogenase small subunit